MANLNRGALSGHLGGDPRKPSETSPVYLRVAVNRPPSADGTERDPHWIEVKVWGKQADACMAVLKKGRYVVVDYRLENRTYEDRGERRSVTEVVANSVEFGPDRPTQGSGEPAVTAASSSDSPDF